MTIGLSAPPSTLDPLIATDATGQRILELLQVPLVRVDNNLNVIPYGAISIAQTDKKIRFQIRNDIQFNNNEKLDCQSFSRAFDVFSKPPSAFIEVFKNVRRWACSKADSFEVEMIKPDPKLLLNLFQIPALPLKRDFKNISAGPFELFESSDEKIVLRSRSGGGFPKPNYEFLEFKVVRDDTTRLLKLINQELDIVQNELPESKVQLAMETQRFNLFKGAGLNVNYINLNHRAFPFNTRNFRIALSELIDRKGITQFKYFNLASPANSLLSPANPLSNFALKNLTYDPENAKKMLSQFESVKSISLLTSNAEVSRDFAVILKDQFRRYSKIDLKIESLDWSGFYSRLKNGNFQMALGRWTGIIDPDIYRESLSTDQKPPGKNRGYYSNIAFDQIVGTAADEQNLNNRTNLYFRAQQMIYDDLAVIPLWFNDAYNIVHKRVKNYQLSTNGSYFPLVFCRLEGD